MSAYEDFAVTGSSGNTGDTSSKWSEIFTAAGDETDVVIPNDRTYTVGAGEIAVYVEGILQIIGDEYTEKDTTTITLSTALSQNERVVIQQR